MEDLAVQREWVLPASTGEKWTLKRFAWVFDGMSEREVVKVPPKEQPQRTGEGGVASAGQPTGSEEFEWKDAKRVVLGMVAHNGMGGDGTVTYYIMQEGEVKPRQNG